MAQLHINPAVRATLSDQDGSIVINLESGKVFSLNGQGAKLWGMLERGVSLRELIGSLAQEYNLSPQQVRQDVEVFINRLQRSGLVQEAVLSSGEK